MQNQPYMQQTPYQGQGPMYDPGYRQMQQIDQTPSYPYGAVYFFYFIYH